MFYLKDVGMLEIPADLSARLRNAAGEILKTWDPIKSTDIEDGSAV